MRSRILVVALILFLGFVFVSSGLADLYIINDLEGKNVCITNISTEIAKYRELGYTLILVKYSNLKLKASEAKETEIKQDTGAVIQIVDWTNQISNTGNYHIVEGILKNVGKNIVDYVEVTTVCFDKAGKLVTTDRTYANPYTLSPGQEAIFRTMIRYNAEIETFQLRVNWKEN